VAQWERIRGYCLYEIEVGVLCAILYNNCPEAIKSQIDLLINFSIQILENNLLGVYLHGSLAMGRFNPQLSDIILE